jgi:hypothetical protein
MNQMIANKFCSECGNSLIETAVICPKCGSPTARFGQYVGPNGGGNPGVVQSNLRKSKTVAVVLAVFLGIWSYLYTYKKDVAIFWISFAVQTLVFISIMVYPDDNIGPNPAWLISVVFNVVALIVQASRASAWFERFPNN